VRYPVPLAMSTRNGWLLFRPLVETAPEELKLPVHLRGQAHPRRWTLGCKPSRGDSLPDI